MNSFYNLFFAKCELLQMLNMMQQIENRLDFLDPLKI
jgi:hypothetical protein